MQVDTPSWVGPLVLPWRSRRSRISISTLRTCKTTSQPILDGLFYTVSTELPSAPSRDVTYSLLSEPVQVSVGLPLAPKSWTPQFDSSVAPAESLRLGVHWLTSYFQHGDLSIRSLDKLEYVVPSTMHAPSVFTMPERILSLDQSAPDAVWYMHSNKQLHASYKRACFDESVRSKLPKMKIRVLCGNYSLSFSIDAAWVIERDNAEAGGGFVDLQWVPGTNHFVCFYHVTKLRAR